mmetsp:Transcript_86690/g.250362  ORF Transcript_86690/g.250362 Transcript_86690/m.250362 type:complete len:223 (-) Transcript_86690:126-794(-)
MLSKMSSMASKAPSSSKRTFGSCPGSTYAATSGYFLTAEISSNSEMAPLPSASILRQKASISSPSSASSEKVELREGLRGNFAAGDTEPPGDLGESPPTCMTVAGIDFGEWPPAGEAPAGKHKLPPNEKAGAEPTDPTVAPGAGDTVRAVTLRGDTSVGDKCDGETCVGDKCDGDTLDGDKWMPPAGMPEVAANVTGAPTCLGAGETCLIGRVIAGAAVVAD